MAWECGPFRVLREEAYPLGGAGRDGIQPTREVRRGQGRELAGTKAAHDEGIARRRVTAHARRCPRWCSLSVPSLESVRSTFLERHASAADGVAASLLEGVTLRTSSPPRIRCAGARSRDARGCRTGDGGGSAGRAVRKPLNRDGRRAELTQTHGSVITTGLDREHQHRGRRWRSRRQSLRATRARAAASRRI
jgi:hypothetical protein